MSILDPDQLLGYEEKAFVENHELFNFVKRLSVFLKENGASVFSSYYENWDDDTLTETRGFNTQFSGFGTTFDLEELRKYLDYAERSKK